MPIAFISAPYRSVEGHYGVLKNIHAAGVVARQVWCMGFAAMCPCMNTAFFSGSDIEEDAFLEGALVLLGVSDVVVMVGHWRESAGCRAEFEAALEWDIEVVEWERDGSGALEAFRREREAGRVDP